MLASCPQEENSLEMCISKESLVLTFSLPHLISCLSSSPLHSSELTITCSNHLMTLFSCCSLTPSVCYCHMKRNDQKEQNFSNAYTGMLRPFMFAPWGTPGRIFANLVLSGGRKRPCQRSALPLTNCSKRVGLFLSGNPSNISGCV